MKNNIAKPFLKWAGGKTQLIDQIEEKLPKNIYNAPFTYIEPFVGSGAILFWMLAKFPNLKEVVINDINVDLINCYRSIKNNVEDLIDILAQLQNEYHGLLNDEDKEKGYYYEKRRLFNTRKLEQTEHSALVIFLNRTCFNGLYRVNKKNKFNVPKGRYKKPQICNVDNLLAVSTSLQNVEILSGDYSETLPYARENTFFYLDPPYKPLTTTSSFTSYTKGEFDDSDQIRLKEFCEQLDNLGYSWMLSNSDVRNTDPENDFFDDLYSDFQIFRVFARRNINSKGNKRGKLTELLITNQVLTMEGTQ